MFTRKSRYAKARSFVAAAGVEAFGGVRPRTIDRATGVIEHTVQQGDRLDLLAKHYYNDDRLWWRIVDANPEILHGADALAEARAEPAGDPLAVEQEMSNRLRQGNVLLIPALRD